VPAIMLAVAIGSVVFHLASPWWWGQIASNWQYIDDTINLTFWITGFVFVVVIVFMAWCAHRFRHRPGNRAHYEPESKKLEWTLTIVTAVGVAALLTPGLFVWHQFITPPDDATEIEAVGQQWYWTFRLPGEDGVLGTSATRLVSSDNPLGVNPDDPAGRDDVIVQSGALHLPRDVPVIVHSRSVDVLHNFYVPEFRVKMDLVPGMVTQQWFTPIRTGTFPILCFEFCGEQHYNMRGQVVIDEAADYDAWLAEQETFGTMLAAARGEEPTAVAANEEIPAAAADGTKGTD
jgi:cytochrome c oxidase subunit 2